VQFGLLVFLHSLVWPPFAAYTPTPTGAGTSMGGEELPPFKAAHKGHSLLRCLGGRRSIPRFAANVAAICCLIVIVGEPHPLSLSPTTARAFAHRIFRRPRDVYGPTKLAARRCSSDHAIASAPVCASSGNRLSPNDRTAGVHHIKHEARLASGLPRPPSSPGRADLFHIGTPS